ncbi:membrane protein insertion efficiency factor YidD [Isosphaeraceae bacterium EP7]
MSRPSLPSRALIASIRAYQATFSQLLGPACIYEPSCSRYMVGAIEKYGLVRGVLKGLRRIGRCHPWGRGGFDPP